MKKAAAIVLSVVLVIGAVIGGICIYNSTYPDSYIEENFSEAEIISKEVYDGSWSLFYSTEGYRFVKYTMYDPAYDVEFEIEFERNITSPFYKLCEVTAEQYYNRIEHIEVHSFLKQEITAIVTEEYPDCYIVDNPCDDPCSLSDYGFHIYIGKLDTSVIEHLTAVLDSYISSQRRENGYYIEYSLNICMDDKILNEIRSADLSKADTGALSVGQAYFTDMLEKPLNCKITRITASNDGFDEFIYENPGDTSDDEYQSPENFEHLIFWYDSEPNSLPNGSHFYLFGID